MKRIAELVVALLAVVSIFTVMLEYIIPFSAEEILAVYVFDLLVVVVLAADFYVRARATESWRRYVMKQWYELLALIPAFVFALVESQPAFGAALRSLRLVRAVRVVAATPRLIRAFHMMSYVMRESKLTYLLTASSVIISAGAVAVYVLESNLPNARITNLSDAFWWALATVTTVGYGDVVPVTAEGRLMGTMLMLVGIAVLGILISNLGATLVERRLRREVRELKDEAKELIKQKIDSLETLTQEELEVLLNMIKSLHQC